MSDRLPRDRREERGVVMVLVALAMTALLLFGALAIDVGAVWASRTQSQNADDAAALAAAQKMIDANGQLALASARTAGRQVADRNATLANPVNEGGTGGIQLRDQDFEFGFWDFAGRTLDTSVDGMDPVDPERVTGVRVSVVMDGAVNNRSPSFFSRLLGRNGFDVTSQAVAYRGFEGEWVEGEFRMPMAIDSCMIGGEGGCGANFCAIADDMPNDCEISEDNQQGGAGAGDVTCLRFNPTGSQDACWTVFDGDSSSVSTSRLRRILREGNSDALAVGEEIHLDNGTKEDVLREIGERFYGLEGSDFEGDPHGDDRYPPTDGTPDSWIVKLPVMECGSTNDCDGSTYRVMGAVCFEIREVDWSGSNKSIKGKFLCPNSDDPNVQSLYQEFCTGGPSGTAPGGCNFGFRADRVVLVQ